MSGGGEREGNRGGMSIWRRVLGIFRRSETDKPLPTRVAIDGVCVSVYAGDDVIESFRWADLVSVRAWKQDCFGVDRIWLGEHPNHPWVMRGIRRDLARTPCLGGYEMTSCRVFASAGGARCSRARPGRVAPRAPGRSPRGRCATTSSTGEVTGTVEPNLDDNRAAAPHLMCKGSVAAFALRRARTGMAHVHAPIMERLPVKDGNMHWSCPSDVRQDGTPRRFVKLLLRDPNNDVALGMFFAVQGRSQNEMVEGVGAGERTHETVKIILFRSHRREHQHAEYIAHLMSE